MPRQNENCPAHRHDLALLMLCGMPRDDLSILNKNAIINDRICLVLMRHQKRTMALAGPARTHQSYYVHLYST